MPKHFVLLATFSLLLTAANFAQARNELVGMRTAAIISNIDDSVVNEFQKAWLLSRAGFEKTEALVLLYRMPDGSILARPTRSSGLSRRSRFPWTASIVAVVHTHPNDADPEPAGKDLEFVKRFGVPIFTITQHGMFVHDPDTRKTSMVHQGLDWLKTAKWNRYRQAAAQAPAATKDVLVQCGGLRNNICGRWAPMWPVGAEQLQRLVESVRHKTGLTEYALIRMTFS